MNDLTYCEVVAQRRQFAWWRKKGLVELTPEALVHYNQALEHGPVFTNEKILFFYSGRKPSWAGKMVCRRIGQHYFCEERK